MATFRDESGKLLTGEEVRRMMESARPLTDEELEEASGGLRIAKDGRFITCPRCKGEDFLLYQEKRWQYGDSESIFMMKCKKCGYHYDKKME